MTRRRLRGRRYPTQSGYFKTHLRKIVFCDTLGRNNCHGHFGMNKAVDTHPQSSTSAALTASSDQIKRIAEQAKAWGNNTQLRQIAEQAKAWSDSPQLRQIAEQAKAWGDDAQLRKISEQTKVWSTHTNLSRLALQILPESLTFHDLLSELVARSAGSTEQPPSVSIPDHVSADAESSVSIGDYYTVEIIPGPNTKPLLSEVPNWLLYLWLICITPAFAVLTNWEAMRVGLVDINARLPQTSSFADLRRFIRSNLAGKPGDIRLVAGSEVRLRIAPGMKSDVILTLPKNAPVVVLGKEDRTWLYVSYEHEGFILDGYVSTKFLKRVRK